MAGEERLKALRYEPEATEEMQSGRDDSSDPKAFDEELFSALDLLASCKVMGGRIGPKSFRQWILPRLPYSLIYRDRDGEIRVFAFAHHKRRPGYWRDRLNNTPL